MQNGKNIKFWLPPDHLELLTAKPGELLEANDCEVKKLVAADGPIPEQLKKELPEADAVIAGLEDYDEALIACGKNLKVISRYGVGYDKVDVKAAGCP